MRTLLLIILLVPMSSAGQEAAPARPGERGAAEASLAVVKFSWKRGRRGWIGGPGQSSVSDSTPGADISTGGSLPPSRQPREPSFEEQAGALRRAEWEAARSRAHSPGEFYKYEVRVRNGDARAVRAFYWSFETRQSLRPDDVSRRQFFCAAKIKPGKSREIEARGAKAPSLTVGADVMASDAVSPERVVVNRVEYADGSVWQRPGWSPYRAALPPGVTTLARVRGCIELRSPRRK